MKEISVKALPYIIALDDEIDLLEMFKLCMEARGYEVDIATNEQAMMDLIKVKTPAVIFLDIQMPGKQGNEMCKELKANATTANIPIVFLSGKEDALQLAAESRADGCISKPFHCNMVVAEIDRIMANS